jgi:hypothetical protein
MKGRALLLFLGTALFVSVLEAADLSVEPIISRLQREPVESRAIAAVGYSKRLRALEIEFHRGGTYRYLHVPPSVHRELLAAKSKARFYNKKVRGKYRALRVKPRAEKGRRR